MPEYTDGAAYYTVNRIVPTDFYKDVHDKHDFVANRYRELVLQPEDGLIRELDLKKYVDITSDERKRDDFLKKLAAI